MSSDRFRQALGPLLILAAIGVTFANTLHNTFALDDFYRVVGNPGIQQVWPPWRHFVDPSTMSTLDRITGYRPLLPLTLSLQYALTGESVVAFRLGNLALHALSALLVWALALELLTAWARPALAPGRARAVALVAALLYAVHPVAGITVNYISARDLLLMQCTLLGTLLVWARLRRRPPETSRTVRALYWGAALSLLVLSLLSKQNAVVAPLLIAAFELTLGGGRLAAPQVWLRTLPFAALVAASFAWTRWGLGFSDIAQVLGTATTPWTYALTQARLYVTHYLPHLVWPLPIRQMPEVAVVTSPWNAGVIAGALFVVATLTLAWRWRHRARVASFGILAAWIMMIPESSFFPLIHLASDYRLYPPSAFLWLVVSLLAAERIPWRTRRMAGMVAGTAIVYAAAMSVILNRTWRTEETLWSHSVRYGAEGVAHMSLAMSITNRYDPRVRAHLDTALLKHPGNVLANINRGLLDIEFGATPAGVARVEHAVELAPTWAQAHFWLAHAYRTVGRLSDAQRASAQAAALAPRDLAYQYRAALDAQNAGDWAGTLAMVEHIARTNPDYAETQFIAGFALQQSGRLEEALAAYERFLAGDAARQNPASRTQVLLNVALTLEGLGRCAEAVPYGEQVLAARPGDRPATALMERCRNRR